MTQALEGLKRFTNWLGDRLLGIETLNDPNALSAQRSWLEQRKPRHGDPIRHDTTAYPVLIRLARKLGLRHDDVVIDLGCGMGRAVCYLARWPVAKVIGIEFFEPLCEIAQRNAARVRRRKAPVEIRCGDVSEADLSEGTVFFLYNPFGPATLRDAVDHIEDSLEKNPRRLVLVYYKPEHENLIRSRSSLQLSEEFRCLTGNRVTIWHSPRPY